METTTPESVAPADSPVEEPRSTLVIGGRFISPGRLAGASLYWLAWLAFSPRTIVSAGVQRELDALGVGALRLVASASLLVGLITTFQIASELSAFSAESMSGRALGWFAARELGPLSVALLVVARSGAAIAGELASMTANAEIDALRAMGLDPIKYLVAPKLAALLIALPALTILADGLIILGGWIGNTVFLDYSTSFYLNQYRAEFSVADVFLGLVKSVMFAFVLGIAAADAGLSIERRFSAIGAAATRGVVVGLIGVLATDTVVNGIFYFIPGLSS
ncbi:MAG: ABC transporter permease [Gemmatimonadaceae bacterium]